MLLFLVLVLVASCLSLYVWWLRVLRSGSGPMVKGCLPIIGYAHKIIGNTEKLYKVLVNLSNESLKHGGICRAILGMENYYVITDPEDLTTVANNALLKHFSFDFAKPWLGNGLITAPASVWKLHRRILSPAFSRNQLYSYLQVYNDEARSLTKTLSSEVGNDPVNVTNLFKMCAMKILSQTSFGLTNSDETDFLPPYMKGSDTLMEMIVTRFQNVWLHSNLMYTLTGLKKQETAIIKELNKISEKVINIKRSEVKDIPEISDVYGVSDKVNNAVLGRLLRHATESALTEKEVLEEVHTIMVAGVDTTSWVITYISVYIGSYPEVQRKICQELTEVFEGLDRDVTKDDLTKLVYLEAVILETLRLHPIGIISLRTLETGLQLKKHYLRPGDHIIMSFYGVNRHSSWGPDADEFRPERWLEGKSLPSAYSGFGLGKRICIGKTYAMMLMKIVLSHMLRRYSFRGDATKLKFKSEYVLKAVSGYHVSVSERRTNFEPMNTLA